MVDAARLADELRAEQDHATSLVNTILISLRHKILYLLLLYFRLISKSTLFLMIF